MEVILLNFFEMMIPLGICVILPITIVWLAIRHKTNETNRRTEIIMAALEKNQDIDVEEFLKKLNPPKKSVKEKLAQKLFMACVLIAIGTALIGIIIFLGVNMAHVAASDIFIFIVAGGILLFLGIGFLIYYLVGKKIFARELEAEQNKI